MTDEALTAALDGLRDEVRRAARAALAAKGAAEEAARLPADDAWAQAVLPALDALDRCEAEATRLGVEHAGPFGTWPFRRPGDPRTAVLADAIRMARDALEGALAARGYRVERPAGRPFHASQHRAIDQDASVAAGLVARVLRAGLCKGERTVREADIVIGSRET